MRRSCSKKKGQSINTVAKAKGFDKSNHWVVSALKADTTQ